MVALQWSSTSLAVDSSPRRVFRDSRYDIGAILARPYQPEVPMGCVGKRLWASSPQGWAFRNDVHWLYLANLNAFDIEISDAHGRLEPAQAACEPSHVHLQGVRRAAVASASFTFSMDNVQNPLSKPFRPEKRWTCWSSGRREDWFAVDFGSPQRLTGMRVFFFDDAPSGGCRPPDEVRIERWIPNGKSPAGDPAGRWELVTPIQRRPEQPGPGENMLEFAPVETSRVRLVFRNRGENYYTGLYGLEPITTQAELSKPITPSLEVSGDKFITADDVLVAVLRLRNTGQQPVPLEARLVCPLVLPSDKPAMLERGGTQARAAGRLHDIDVAYHFAYRLSPSHFVSGRRCPPAATAGSVALDCSLDAGETKELAVFLAVATSAAQAEASLGRWLHRKGSLSDVQREEYQAWFDQNVAYFACSDAWIHKQYYHRAYLLRKNLLEPALGRMQWKAFAEGRWRSGWYPNVISYGGGHQIRESRWLRDKSHWQGHLRTFAENAKVDGVYPSHVRPNGPQGGQYTDWITASAWDGYLVHPDNEFLAIVADKLAANVRGWQNVYDPDGDGLLFVDSHWWTGMEWQPSFFAFCDFKTDPKDRMHPLTRDKLDRVDLTTYNFGNAVAVSRIYRLLGRDDLAAEFDALAEKIRRAVLEKLWDSQERFFYSVRNPDQQKARVKEVIGVYPFYFDLPPVGKGYEQAWASFIDPEQFWTTWPAASASKQCPAYSQDGWPTDRGGSGCMWNGPTWPHANSIVLSAMINSLRHHKDEALAGRLPLTRDHFYALFHSFARAQYRAHDLTFPWTGEFYHGETGDWKTAERDYNHSTWIDVLITGVVGLVPRPDDVLEIDPLVPPGKLRYFLLDAQRYRGHDITVVWDDPAALGDQFGDSRKGLDIYVDFNHVASLPTLSRVTVKLSGNRAGTK
jgi:hypothetical protein